MTPLQTRQRLGLTQVQMAKLLDVSERNIARYEREQNPASNLRHMYRLVNSIIRVHGGDALRIIEGDSK